MPTITASSVGVSCALMRIATTSEASVMVAAIERSKSPAVSGRSRPSVKTSRTPWVPKIVEKLVHVKKRDWPEMAMSIAANATMSSSHMPMIA